MTERFNLAAQVKLSRRLKNLLRIDEQVEIDMSYITCAEYQLFIDEKRTLGENLQPDHWAIDRFPVGDAKKPIVGVRASDAKAFCQWLTEKYANPGFQYRLPTTSEVREHPSVEQKIGCWCKDEDITVIADIDLQQWQTWQEDLTQLLDLDLAIGLAINLALDRDLAIDFARARALDLARATEMAHYCVLDLARVLARARYLDLNLDLALALDLTIGLDRGRDLDLALAPAIAIALARDLDLAHGRATAIAIDFARALDLALARDLALALARNLSQRKSNFQDNTSLIVSYLLLISVLWALLVDIYAQISRSSKALKLLKLNRNDCEAFKQTYSATATRSFSLYAFFSLIELRRQGEMPAWEGIRIVRERIE